MSSHETEDSPGEVRPIRIAPICQYQPRTTAQYHNATYRQRAHRIRVATVHIEVLNNLDRRRVRHKRRTTHGPRRREP